jgi:hypothetical protein
MCAFVENRMKSDVPLTIDLHITVTHRHSHRAMVGVEFMTLPGGHARARPHGAERLQFRHNVKHIAQLRQIRGHDEGRPVRPQLDKPAGRELPQGLANGRPGRPEPLAKTHFVEGLARGKALADDILRQLRHDLVRERVFRHLKLRCSCWPAHRSV